MRHETRKIERTPEEKARLKAIRERFQREKPSPKTLAESGEYGPPIPTAAYFAVASLVKRLRAEREASGLSLADVAGRTGMDKAALSRLETGRHGNPTIDTLARYAAALGKSVTFGVADLPAAGAMDRGRPSGSTRKKSARARARKP
jgi:ribosome-binding protein aMBF1 (putative translation factor)